MSLNRQYICPLWPSGGYPDWPPVKAILNNEYGERMDFLEADLFREAFWLTGSPAINSHALVEPLSPDFRAGEVNTLSVWLILEKNRGLVRSLSHRHGLRSEHDHDDVISESAMRTRWGGTPRDTHSVLCEWHDANLDANRIPWDRQIKDKKRRAVVRRLIQQPARDQKKAQFNVQDPTILASILSFTPLVTTADPARAMQVAERVLSRCDLVTRSMIDMYYGDKRFTLQQVTDELALQGINLSLAGVWKRINRFLLDVVAEYRSLNDRDE